MFVGIYSLLVCRCIRLQIHQFHINKDCLESHSVGKSAAGITGRCADTHLGQNAVQILVSVLEAYILRIVGSVVKPCIIIIHGCHIRTACRT